MRETTDAASLVARPQARRRAQHLAMRETGNWAMRETDAGISRPMPPSAPWSIARRWPRTVPMPTSLALQPLSQAVPAATPGGIPGGSPRRQTHRLVAMPQMRAARTERLALEACFAEPVGAHGRARARSFSTDAPSSS